MVDRDALKQMHSLVTISHTGVGLVDTLDRNAEVDVRGHAGLGTLSSSAETMRLLHGLRSPWYAEQLCRDDEAVVRSPFALVR